MLPCVSWWKSFWYADALAYDVPQVSVANAGPRARAEHVGDHRPPPRGEVLHRLSKTRARRRAAYGSGQMGGL